MFPICPLLWWAINKIASVFISRPKESSSPCFALKSMLVALLCSFHNSAIETTPFAKYTESYRTQLWFSQKGRDAGQGKQWWISQSEWLLHNTKVWVWCVVVWYLTMVWEKAERLLFPGSQGPDGVGLALCWLVCISKASCLGWPLLSIRIGYP